MMRWLCIAVCGLGGCDAAFGLTTVTLRPDGRAVDAAPDAPPDAAPCQTSQELATLAEDTMLLPDTSPTNADPANRYGVADTINVGQNNISRVLLRFTLPATTAMALVDGTAVGASLELTIRTSGGSCNTGCTSGATKFEVHAANNYWNEGTSGGGHSGAAWYPRMQVGLGDPNVMFWMQPGAAGDTDRSPLVLGTTTSLAGASGTVVTQMKLDDAARADLVGRLDVLRLSLLLTPTSGGTLFLYSREGDTTKAAKLSFTLCR